MALKYSKRKLGPNQKNSVLSKFWAEQLKKSHIPLDVRRSIGKRWSHAQEDQCPAHSVIRGNQLSSIKQYFNELLALLIFICYKLQVYHGYGDHVLIL